MIKGLNKIEVITFFVEDLAATRAFYESTLGLEVVYSDDVSAVVKLENLMINILHTDKADTLVEPRQVAAVEAGTRQLFTFEVADANAVYEELEAHGVTILNGPTDRPWGRRTISFADPAGNVLEIAQVL